VWSVSGSMPNTSRISASTCWKVCVST
jgi:hypothetical protein